MEAGPCRRQVQIEVPADEVGKEFSDVLEAYSKVAKIPGFRPGRAPRDLIKKRYSKEITDEVKERLIPRGYQEAVHREKLETVELLDVQERAVEEGQPFSFTITLDVQPQFNLPEYKGLPLERKKVVVAAEDVDKTIKNILEQNGRYEDITGRPVQTNDMVRLDFEAVCEGKPLVELSPQAASLGKGADMFYLVDDEHDFLPGLGAGLLGASIGDKRQVLVDFPANFAEKTVAGRKATYFVDVKGIREKKLPALDEEFLKSLGVKSEQELRERIEKDLRELRENVERRRLLNEVAQQVLARTSLDVPESVVQRETQQEIYDMVTDSTYRGASKEDIENKKEDIFAAATRNATDRVKLRFIVRRIADAEKIAVSPAEVNARIGQMAARNQMEPEKLRADLAKKNGLDRVEQDVRLTKTLEWLLAQAKISESQV
jgi:trigger factor